MRLEGADGWRDVEDGEVVEEADFLARYDTDTG